MGKIDLKDAYFSIRIHPSHKKLLRFRWRSPLSVKGSTLRFSDSSQSFFNDYAEAVKKLREKGIRLVQYWTTF